MEAVPGVSSDVAARVFVFFWGFGLGFRVPLRIKGLGFRVPLRIKGLGFRIPLRI